MGKAPAFPFYASDFLTDTKEWTDREIGIYIRFLCCEWVNGDISPDNKRLLNLISSNEQQFKNAWEETISHKFQKNSKGRLINKRMEVVRKEMEEHRKKRSKAGRAGADARWHS